MNQVDSSLKKYEIDANFVNFYFDEVNIRIYSVASSIYTAVFNFSNPFF